MPRMDGYNTTRADGESSNAIAIKNIYYDVLSQLKNVQVRRSNVHWDGGADQYGIKHKSIWTKIAVFLDKNQITNYQGYICNTILTHLPGKIYPTHLLSEASIKAFRESQELIRQSFKEKFHHALVTLRSRSANFLLLGDSPPSALKKAYESCSPAFEPIIKALLVMVYDVGTLNSDELSLARIYYSICPDYYEEQVPGLGAFVGYQKIYIPQDEA